jgi:hypothetical protein
VTARLITDAIMGPTQGAQMIPRLNPVRSPPVNPEAVVLFSLCLPCLVARVSNIIESFWTSMIRPKRTINTTATILKAEGGIFNNLMRVARVRVKMLKLKIKPRITPAGRLLPPMLPDKTIGSTGRIQGERIVTTPERKAKNRSIVI